MTLQNVTVIIPAHNRPERLRRLLDYYSRTDIKILVPDSSDHPFADAEKYPDITRYIKRCSGRKRICCNATSYANHSST